MLAPSALAFHTLPRPLGTGGWMDTLSAERKSVDGNFCQLDGYRECDWVGFDQEASSVGVGTCVATGKVCEDRELGMGDGIVFRN